MNKKQIIAKLEHGDFTLTDVIDAVIELNALVGVGCITLGDSLKEYCYGRSTAKTAPEPKPDPKARTYYTWEHNIDGALENGSFVRLGKHGLAQYMNGDFMGFVDAVPEGMARVDTTHAERIIPKVCL